MVETPSSLGIIIGNSQFTKWNFSLVLSGVVHYVGRAYYVLRNDQEPAFYVG